ncbi:DUF481 domain-containing protein [Eudoraea chungangensis]|uniref:DUF481 domain-containing protein n=1 Tax=Eudoraea chungangensis TaxID=1481905 RepID=UPI0023EA8B75|nr:DUF481 domain-containing protein [Eudoraea chungangensis]
MHKFLPLFLFLICSLAFGQRDTLVFRNKDIAVGEIKSLNNGVLILKTMYSDQDFKIEFNKVDELIIQRKSLILLTRGRRRYGNIRTYEPKKVRITLTNGEVEEYRLSEVVALQEVTDRFWGRFKGNIDAGFTLAKANNNTQLTVSGALSYNDNNWISNFSIELLNSSQTNTDRIQRNNLQLELLRLLGRSWYVYGDLAYLSNTEQALKNRYTPGVGVGNLVINTRKLNLGVLGGFTFNTEEFTDDSPSRNSVELLLGSTFNMFDFKDFSLKTNINFFPSLSERGRLRSDFDFNLKYDLPLDFYIKLGFSFNYDNQSAQTGSDFDYNFTSGFGWKFNK